MIRQLTERDREMLLAYLAQEAAYSLFLLGGIQGYGLNDTIAMLGKESVCEFVFFGPNTEQDTRAYFEPLAENIQEALEKNELPDEHVFTIRKPDGMFIGQCGLLPIAYSPGNYLIGFTLDDFDGAIDVGKYRRTFEATGVQP